MMRQQSATLLRTITRSYMNGTMIYDTILIPSEGSGVVKLPGNSDAHFALREWLRSNSTGFVREQWNERRRTAYDTWEADEVAFHFQNPAEAVMAKLRFGGAQ